MVDEVPGEHRSDLYSVRSLLAAKIPGKIKISDVLFSANSLDVRCFKARVRTLIISRTRLLDAGSARLRGDSFVIQDVPMVTPPADAFEFSNLGWVLGAGETRMGDVMDILIDGNLSIEEFTLKLRHRLVLPDDLLKQLPKEVRKGFMRTIPDAATVTGDAYTIASLPVGRVVSVRTNPIYYEVMTNIDVDQLTSRILRALDAGKIEKGMVRRLFEEIIQEPT